MEDRRERKKTHELISASCSRRNGGTKSREANQSWERFTDLWLVPVRLEDKLQRLRSKIRKRSPEVVLTSVCSTTVVLSPQLLVSERREDPTLLRNRRS
jgi:hypothetical protein